MPRKSKNGTFILAAGEIAHYTVCPEAWRLSAIENKDKLSDPSHQVGKELHKVWAQDYEDAIKISRGLRILIEFIILMILLTMLRYSL